jgi:hypothetical protein
MSAWAWALISAQDLLGTGDARDLIAQGFLGADSFLIGFSLGSGNDSVGFGRRWLLRSVERRAFSASPSVRRPFLAFRRLRGTLGRSSRSLSFGSRQAIGDLLRTLVERLHNGRPHELHREPRQNEEHNELGKQGCVQIHGLFLF